MSSLTVNSARTDERPIYLQGISDSEVDALWDALNGGDLSAHQTQLLARLGAPVVEGGRDCGQFIGIVTYAGGKQHFVYQVLACRLDPDERERWKKGSPLPGDGWRRVHISANRVTFRALMATNRHVSNRTEGRAAA